MQNVPFRQSLGDEEKARIDAALAILEPFLEIRPTMPLQYVVAFLHVAREEGLGVKEYAERTDCGVSVMSRHLQDIGDRDRYKEPGFGLITQRQDPMNLRTHQAMLTPLGRTLAHRIARVFDRFHAARAQAVGKDDADRDAAIARAHR
jgi:DNA-binding MarR family transcriptional regulator